MQRAHSRDQPPLTTRTHAPLTRLQRAVEGGEEWVVHGGQDALLGAHAPHLVCVWVGWGGGHRGWS